MLENIWDVLMPGVNRDSRFTKQWIDIGFQGADPATDLRGAGLLGLKQLHHFIMSHKSKAKPMHQNSINQQTWYFFCVTGINITQKLHNSLSDSTKIEQTVNLD